MEVLQVPSELERAVQLRNKHNPRRVLEIGCWDGGTLREWLLATPPPDLVVAVSLEHRQPEKYAEWTQPATELVVGTGDSQSNEMRSVVENNAPYDWAFIDGDHSYHYARADVDLVLPLMNKGGVMLLHDVTPPEDWDTYGPLDVFRELQAEGFKTDIFDVPERFRWSAGIGVVYT